MTPALRGGAPISLVVPAFGVAGDDVVATVTAALGASGLTWDVLVGTGADEMEELADHLGRAGLTGARCVAAGEPADVARLLSEVATRYWALAPPGAPGPGWLDSLVAGLEEQPEAVLACRSAASPSDAPMLLDGPELARLMMRSASNPLGAPAAVVVRTAALGGEASRWRPRGGLGTSWHLGLWLKLMLRGHVWSDGPPVGDPDPGLDLHGWDGWDDLVDEAVALGMFGRPDEEHLARGAGRADDPGRDSLAPDGAVEERRTLVVTGPVGGGLPLDVIVLAEGDGGWSAALATARRAASVARDVVVVARPTDRPTPPLPPAIGWRTLDWQSPAAGDLLDGDRGVPVLVLAAGEQLEVADEGQLRSVLEAAAPGLRAVVASPAGREVRLLWPERGAERDIGSPLGTHVVRSLRITGLGGSGDWLPIVPAAPAADRPLRRFAVLAPDYSERSGGVIALHRLCDVLNGLGHDAWIVPLEPRAATNPAWRTPVSSMGAPIGDDTVAVYPEIVPGNPLGARHVVRWLLNRPGRLNGGLPMREGAGDLVVAFGAHIDPDRPVLSMPLFDPTTFFPKDRPGSGRLLWAGKGNLPDELDRSDMTLITHAWPRDKRELAACLRAADVLVSCDWLTALNDEALLCGTPVVLIGAQEWLRDDLSRHGDLPPGIAWGEDLGPDLDPGDERLRVAGAYPRYLEQLDGTAAHVEAFVDAVNEHFGSVVGSEGVRS